MREQEKLIENGEALLQVLLEISEINEYGKTGITAYTLMGYFDNELIAALNNRINNENLAEKVLERLKTRWKKKITNDLKDEDDKAIINNAGQQKKLSEQFKTIHEQNEHGTIAEMAEKLGVSKKQIRNWKKEGILDEKLLTVN